MSSLTYILRSLNLHDTFADGARWEGGLDGWWLTLAGGELRATSEREFESDAAARADLEPLLRAWQASAYLTDQFSFVFEAAGDAPSTAAEDGAREHVFRRHSEAYPEPDVAFRLTPAVERLLDIESRFRSGSVSLPEAVGEGLAVLREAAGASQDGGPQAIAEAFNIETEVVAALDEMAHRRPAGEGLAFYRGPEWQWLQEALRRITLQAGRRTASAAPAERLAMDLFRARL